MSDKPQRPVAPELLAAGERLKQLMDKPQFQKIQLAMTHFRQCYAVAYHALQALLEKEKDVPELTEDAFIQSAMYAASRPFSEHTLMDGIARSTLPWLARLVDEHIKAEAQQARAEAEVEEKKRREQKVPIGFRHSAPQDENDERLDRDRPLVLVGWRPAITWLLDRIVTTVLLSNDDRKYQIIRLMETGPGKELQPQPQLLRLGADEWKGCCDTGNSMRQTVGRSLFERMKLMPDLLICDDMSQALTTSFIGRPTGAIAGDANKQFRRWCSAAGAAFVGAVPFDSCEPEEMGLGTPIWEQLRTFAYLRPVIVTEEGDKYRLTIGGNASFFDVEKGLLDSVGKPTIIIPGS